MVVRIERLTWLWMTTAGGVCGAVVEALEDSRGLLDECEHVSGAARGVDSNYRREEPPAKILKHGAQHVVRHFAMPWVCRAMGASPSTLLTASN